MDPVYSLQAGDIGDPAAALSLLLMLGGLLVVATAALAEHYLKRGNFITRALDRWSR